VPIRLTTAAVAAVLLFAPVTRAQDCCPQAQPAAGVAATPQASPQSIGQGPCCPFPQGYCPFPQGYCPPPNNCGLCARPLGTPTPYTPRPLGLPCASPQASPQSGFGPSPQSGLVVPAKTARQAG
jgi:hypothetical protein